LKQRLKCGGIADVSFDAWFGHRWFSWHDRCEFASSSRPCQKKRAVARKRALRLRKRQYNGRGFKPRSSSINQKGGTRVNKSELIEVAAKEAGISKAAAEKALSSMIGAVVKAVSKGDSVTLVGFGTFKSAKRAARTGVNPKTGEKLKIAATTVPRFTAGAAFKSAVAGKKAAKKK
jgi:DNA-binding protein HU-beta